MDERISVSVLSRACDVLGDTNRGLSGKKLIGYCNTFAVEHDVRIPHATYPFDATSKRTALFENVQAFSPRVQYRLLMEISDDWHYRANKEVKEIRALIEKRYSHLAVDEFAEEAMNEPQPLPSVVVPPRAPASQFSSASVRRLSKRHEPAEPFDIFLSYSHEDEALMNVVRQHLVLYDRLGKIRKWWDRKLVAGAPLDRSITNYLISSDIILLFVSPSFLASDYCYDVEMQQALAQHRNGQSVVVPVILRHCGWSDTWLRDLVALPTDGRPLKAWPDQDEGAKNIADGVMKLVGELQRERD